MDAQYLIDKIKSYGGENAWVYQVFVVVLFVVAANFFIRIFLNRLHEKLEKTAVKWDDAFIDALRKPASLLVWVVGITFSAEIAKGVADAAIFNVVEPVRDVGVIGAITWFLIRFIRNMEANLTSIERHGEHALDATTVNAISRLLRLSVLITSALVIMQTLGYSISGVLAFGGIGGIAIGFAAKDLLANFFGGMMIFLDRPFSVGDWIRSPEKEIEGTVEHIGWRLTRIRTFDKRPLYIPNSVFASIVVENPSRMTNRRIYETIGIRYDDAAVAADVIAAVREMLQNHPDIDHNQTLMVNFNKFGASSLDFFIYTFTKTTVWTQFHEVKQDVLFKIQDIIEAHGAEIAFPTSTVHLPDQLKVIQANAEGLQSS